MVEGVGQQHDRPAPLSLSLPVAPNKKERWAQGGGGGADLKQAESTYDTRIHVKPLPQLKKNVVKYISGWTSKAVRYMLSCATPPPPAMHSWFLEWRADRPVRLAELADVSCCLLVVGFPTGGQPKAWTLGGSSHNNNNNRQEIAVGQAAFQLGTSDSE